ncbi:MAG TPA: cation:proton antiporter [Thermoleophilia bacterium]|nr:cation:proton antiporter [Thermoleophilia bacterium]
MALGTVAVILVLWSTFSRPLDRRGVTSALVFMLAGLAVGVSALGLVDLQLESVVAERVAELALVLLLFSDAMRLDLGALRHELGWPSRLLFIGLPLSLVAGVGAGYLAFPGMAFGSIFVLATMLAATDAALGQKVVSDEAVPARVRQALDVESGLNDGLSVPFFLVALDIANAELKGGVGSAVLGNAAEQIGWGLLAGAAAGLGGGLLFRLAERRGWFGPGWRQLLPLAAALVAFAVAGGLGGSGFIAAFVGGMVFGRASGEHGAASLFTEETGDLLACFVWIGFGALVLGPVLTRLTWHVVLYAVLSLTVVRMIPVAVAMVGSGARRPTVAFMGWFGPRGLASLVFGLLVVERGVPEQGTLLATVALTVALSVILHGLTSAPLVARYHRWYERHVSTTPEAEEAAPARLPRRRREVTASDVARLKLRQAGRE